MSPDLQQKREAYMDLLRSKIPQAEQAGFEPPSPCHPSLFPHQRDICEWAIRGGRRAIFCNFGLGKTRMQLQIAAWIIEHIRASHYCPEHQFTPPPNCGFAFCPMCEEQTIPVVDSAVSGGVIPADRGSIEGERTQNPPLEHSAVKPVGGTAPAGTKYLIVAPLGVRQEFTQSDGPAMGLHVEYVRTNAEVAASSASILITNYERVRDGDIDVSQFAGAGLDEASVLRSYGSKTYKNFLALFKSVRYRFVFTATPSPNRHKELIHYAGFLDIMDTGDALTRFFKRDSEKANNLTLMPSMEKQFWLWLNSWAVFLQKPSDLGYDDTGYDLPPLNVHWHRVGVDHHKAWSHTDSWGQRQLFQDQAAGLAKGAEIKRESIELRIAKAIEIMGEDAHDTLAPPAVKCLEDAVMDAALHIVEQQSVLHQIRAGKSAKEAIGTCGASRPVHWMTAPKGIKIERGVDEKPLLLPWRWIEARAKAYYPASSRHWIIWHDLEDERRAIEAAIPEAVTVYGSQELEEREARVMGFTRGEFRILASKPVLCGSGCNFQRHCADAIFLGVGYKFNDFVQAVHRIRRFLQTKEVNIHIIYLESEESIMAALQQKWQQHDALMAQMQQTLRENKLSTLNTAMELVRTLGIERAEVRGERFRAINNDSVLELQAWEENSVHHICTSIPFGNQYEYSPSYNDFGHNQDNAAFFRQMSHLVPELLRVLKPGRIAAVHVKDRIRFGNITGFACPTVEPFSDMTVRAFTDAGFVYMARITIDTDVVRENAQTYRLGWSENAKDSSKMGAGMPEYVLIFRKLPSDLSNAYADEPVTKSKVEYTRADWQLDAAGLWRSNGNRLPDPDILLHMPMEDIKRLWIEWSNGGGYSHEEHAALAKALEKRGKLPSSYMLFPAVSRNKDIWTDISRMRTLNSEQSRRNEENHVCPLQLDVIKRLITRYTQPDELVLDPFGGIGSTGFQALKMGRRAATIELNAEYWRCGVGYCEMAEAEQQVPTLFDLAALANPQQAEVAA